MANPFILALLMLAGVGGFAISGIGLVRAVGQREHDTKRRHYAVSLPRDLDFQAVLSFVRSLGGLQTGPLARLGGVPTIVFEVEADARGIRHRIAVPNHLADFVIAQLRGQLPGVHVTIEEPLHHERWHEAAELRMTSQRVPLRIGSAPAVIATLLSSFQPLKGDEALLMQWVITPGFPERTANEDLLHKQKFSDHTFQAVGRLAARAENAREAHRLLRRIFIGLSSMKSYGVAFRTRHVPRAVIHRRVELRGAVLGFPCLFNATEMATVMAFPVAGLNLPGLPQGRSRQLAADPSIPETGLIIGSSNFPGAERPLAISATDLLRHLWIGGPTGVGKSTVLHNLAVQIMWQGHGLMLLEPKGDLVSDVLNSIPDHRRPDVILFDPSDTAWPVGLNILADSDPERITGHVVALFKSLYADNWGPRLEYILRYAVLTAALKSLSLYDVKQLLLSPAFRRGVVRGIRYPEVREFWQWFEKTNEQAVDSVVNKLDGFLGYSLIRNIIGQPQSGFRMEQVIAENKILLVPLPSGLVGDANAAMLGSLIVSQAWQAARGRAGIVREDRVPFFMLIDEFQNFLNLPVAIGDALAQARGYGLGLVLANQHLAQLKPDVRAGVMANARSKIIFQSPADDARALTAELAPYVQAVDLQNLGRYEAVVKLMADDVAAPPATASLTPPPRATGSAWSVRAASRAAYGRPIKDVEADFRTRHKHLSEDVQRPQIGREESS